MATKSVIEAEIKEERDAEVRRKLTNAHNDIQLYIQGKTTNKVNSIIHEIRRDKSQRVLDVGCGFGGLAIYCSLLGMDTVGVDIDETSIEKAKDLARLYGVGDVKLYVQDACDIQVNGFDLAFSTDFYEHLPYDMQIVHLRSVYSVLNPGGSYVFRSPHIFNVRQHRKDHIGLPSYESVLEKSRKVGFSMQHFVAHTQYKTSIPYPIYLERFLERNVSDQTRRYKLLKKFGISNVIVKLTKPLAR